MGDTYVMGATAIVCGLLTQHLFWWLIPAVAAGITAVALFILFRWQVRTRMGVALAGCGIISVAASYLVQQA